MNYNFGMDIKFFEDMPPYEREVYITLLVEKIEKENEKYKNKR